MTKAGTIRYIKKAKKSKSVIYILRDFDGNVIDVTNNNDHSIKYFESNGNELTEWQYHRLDYAAKYQNGIKAVAIKNTDEGYEEEHPFVFDAEFEIVGASGGKSYDSLTLALINGPGVDLGYNWQTGERLRGPRKFAITTHNYYNLLKLIKDKHQDFSYIIRQNYDSANWNNLEVQGYRGRWVFEFNKYTLAVKPYVEKDD